MKIAIIGMGYWGPNYHRILTELGHDVAICDPVKNLMSYKGQKFTDYREAIKASDAVIVAAPTSKHYEITQYALFQEKHVLCEKPLTLNPLEHFHLINNARENDLILFPGLTFLFNEAVQKINEHFFEDQDYGECIYIRTERVNNGPERIDVHAIADLATHDISILSYFLGKPKYINSGLIKRPDQPQPGSGYLNLEFNGVKTSTFVSWNEPVKGRLIRMVFEGGTIDFDDTKLSPVVNYADGISLFNVMKPERQPLNIMVDEFLTCIEEGDCDFGIRKLQDISSDVTGILSLC